MPSVTIPAEIAERTARFVGRAWVIDPVLDWIESGTQQVLLLTSELGSGKTALAAWLAGAGPSPADAQTAANLARIRSVWNAAHFCIGRTRGESINPSRFASELAQQLSDRFPDFASAAITAIDPEYRISQTVGQNWGEVIGVKTNTLIINGRHPEEVYDLAVRRPLEVLLAAKPSLRIFIVVDALDEALLYDSEHNIVSLLASSASLASGVRFLLTCRSNERRVIDRFDSARLLDISSPAWKEANNGDMHSYVLARLANPALAQRIPAGADTTAVADKLVAAAERNFLYMRFLLDEVQAGQRNLDDLASLPRGMFALYRRFLDRVIPDSGSSRLAATWLNDYEPLLGCLSVAAPVAPNQVLPRWLGWNKGQVQALMNTITQVVECTEEYGGGCTLYHRSMAEFLASDVYQENNSRRSNQYYAEPLRQHDRIARYYLKAARDTWEGNWNRCDDYGLSQLVTHLRLRLTLADEDDQPPLASDLYDVVTDPGFRAAQQQRFAAVSAPLPGLRLALEAALARDELGPALRCIAAYRQTVRSQSVTGSIFRAVDQGDFAAALKAADYYGPAPKPRGRWARALHYYLAWEAAEQGLPDAAQQAASAAASLAPTDWTHALYEDLSDSLAVRAARRLAESESEVTTQLHLLAHDRDVNHLLVRHPTPSPLGSDQMQGLETDLNDRLDRLERLAAEGSAEFVSGVLILDPETMASETYSLSYLLTALAPYPAGQSAIDRAIAANLTNPYPRYRDIALVPIAIAAAQAPDVAWARERLRTILRTGLDSEGITFTFDLPAVLLGEAVSRQLAAPKLADYLDQALAQDDRWGTQIRARNAHAAALFWQGQTGAAHVALQEASQVPNTYAGYASLALLLLASRCVEFGVPERINQPLWGLNADVSLLEGAARLAHKVYDGAFRDERQELVAAYQGWLDQPAPDLSALRTTLGSVQDPDQRRVYKDLAGARWVAAVPPDLEALKGLVLMMLTDSTTLDAALGRLVGLRIREHRLGTRPLRDAELTEAIAVCSEHFTAGRPWEFGQWY